MKSKYNTGKPIDINSLTKEERNQAFREWAEGSKALEKLLHIGYKKGFLSLACCGGDTGHPYICYDLNDERSRKIAMCIASSLIESPEDCEITIYNNFELNDAYPETYPDRGITRLSIEATIDNKEEIFSLIGKVIKKARLRGIKIPITEDEIPTKSFKQKTEKTSCIIEGLSSQVYDDGGSWEQALKLERRAQEALVNDIDEID